MINGLEMGFNLTANIMWTYKVTHIEWAGNQSLGLKLVFKPTRSLCELINLFPHLRVAARVVMRLNLMLAHLSHSRFPGRLIRVDGCRGWSDPATEGLTHT